MASTIAREAKPAGQSRRWHDQEKRLCPRLRCRDHIGTAPQPRCGAARFLTSTSWMNVWRGPPCGRPPCLRVRDVPLGLGDGRQSGGQKELERPRLSGYERDGAVRAVLGRGNPEYTGLVPADTAPTPRPFGRGACDVCPGAPVLKVVGTGCTRFSNSPIMGGQGLVCGGAPQTQALSGRLQCPGL